MSIGIYIIIVLAVILIGWLIVFAFDYLLARGAFRLIIGKAKEHLDAEKLKELLQKYMENRRQKWAFKTYMGAVTLIIGGGGVIPFIKANLFVENQQGVIDLQLWIDNSVPTAVLIIALVVATLAYFALLYFSNLKYKNDILSQAAKVINREFEFVPTQDWFKEKSELNIRNLGKKIDLSVNFKYELFEDAFASTCRDERMTRLFVEEKAKLTKDFSRSKERFPGKLDKQELDTIARAVRQVVDGLSLKHLDEKGLDSIEAGIDEAEAIFRDAIIKKKIDYDDYDYSNIHSDFGKIREHIGNPWVQSIKGQSMIVYGKGGYGKTHLLAKIVERRLEEKEPTIFFLGRVITDSGIPMDQVLASLDLKCKKETFYQALDDYGKKHGRVLLIIDGINEGIVGLSLWEHHLLSLLNEIQPYKNIGLIVSVRTNGGESWIDRFIRDEGFPSYEHRGFEKNVSGAVEYMFKSFSVPLPVWPVMNNEFRNPMLLTLFCRSHQGETTPPAHETRLEIIENYIKHFNERLSSFFQYSSSVAVLQDVLHEVAAKMVEHGNRWRMDQAEVLAIIGRNQIVGDRAAAFLNALTDEGLINEYFYSEQRHYYTFGYDTMGGYLIASTMVEQGNISGDLLYDEAVVEALTDVVPAKTGKELFEVVKEEDCGFPLVQMFVEGLPMRNLLTDAGTALLMSYLDDGQWRAVFDIVARVPYRSDWPLNANVLDGILKPMRMVERDAVWTTVVSGYSDAKESISTLVSWAWSASDDVVAHLDRDVLLLICRQLIWMLATTDLTLRDKTTRALVNLLRKECDGLLKCIEDYHDVNDDYIVERLYAVAFGCCTGNQTKTYVEKVAQKVYDCLFRDGDPRENILIRDFGKCIVDYALSLGCTLDYEVDKIAAPYNKEKKNVEVATDEIRKYELDFDSTEDKDMYRAQENIMYSMRTEYSSRGMYGDFGRYTFQALLDNWDDDIEKVSNWAIRYIFEEIGYDANVFKKFDGQYSSQLRNRNSIERIGKKYQWIAMHKVAAILADNHYGEVYDRDWHSPVNVSARKFDPTLFMNPDMKDYGGGLPRYEVPVYDLSRHDDEKWMKNWRDMPDVRKYIEYEVGGEKWIDLYSYYTISTERHVEQKLPEGKSERELWSFVQAFMVDKKDRRRMCRRIHKDGLSGRSGSENRDVSSVYYREYYWSATYKEEVVEEGLTSRAFEAGRRSTNVMVQPAYLLYSISEYSDASLTESQEVIMPSPVLYEELGMRFSVNDGVWLAADGSVACFDSHWVHGGNGCLLMRKDLLLDYLRKKNKRLVWPVLMERTYKPAPMFWPRIQVGGYIWMDERGEYHSRFRSYEETWKDQWKAKAEGWMKVPANKMKLFLFRRGLLKMSGTEALWLMIETDDRRKKEALKFKGRKNDK